MDTSLSVAATALPFVLLVTMAGIVWVAVRQRRHFAEHPEDRPFGKRLLYRVSPFIALSVAICL